MRLTWEDTWMFSAPRCNLWVFWKFYTDTWYCWNWYWYSAYMTAHRGRWVCGVVWGDTSDCMWPSECYFNDQTDARAEFVFSLFLIDDAQVRSRTCGTWWTWWLVRNSRLWRPPLLRCCVPLHPFFTWDVQVKTKHPINVETQIVFLFLVQLRYLTWFKSLFVLLPLNPYWDKLFSSISFIPHLTRSSNLK